MGTAGATGSFGAAGSAGAALLGLSIASSSGMPVAPGKAGSSFLGGFKIASSSGTPVKPLAAAAGFPGPPIKAPMSGFFVSDSAVSNTPSSSKPKPEYPEPLMPFGFGGGSGFFSSGGFISFLPFCLLFLAPSSPPKALKSGASPPAEIPLKRSSTLTSEEDSSGAASSAGASSSGSGSGGFGFSGMPRTKSWLSSMSGIVSGMGTGTAFSPRSARRFISLPNLRSVSLSFFNWL